MRYLTHSCALHACCYARKEKQNDSLDEPLDADLLDRNHALCKVYEEPSIRMSSGHKFKSQRRGVQKRTGIMLEDDLSTSKTRKRPTVLVPFLGRKFRSLNLHASA